MTESTIKNRFKNKCVLVTGGGSGIGKSACLSFGREGACVGVADISIKKAKSTALEIKNNLGNARALVLDVTNQNSVFNIIKHFADEFGSIDILVNCAGIREVSSFLNLTLKEWKKVIAVNLTGTFLCSQAFAQHIVKQRRSGKIINIASVAGLMGVPERPAYVSSKHGVVGLTKQMALDLGPKGIQVNAIAPSVVETPMTAYYFKENDTIAALRKNFPLGRWGKTADTDRLILFLASEDADFISGAVIPIDGGYTAGKRILIDK